MRKCRHCRAEIPKKKDADRWQAAGFCDIDHMTDYGRRKADEARQKQRRRETRQARQRLKTRSDWLRDAQTAFNAYIRARDAHLPCIDCGSYGPDDDWLTGGKWDAGHYLSVGSHPELRFNEDNCHKQLKTCNGGSGKYARKRRTVAEGYREGLIARVGLERVEALEGPHEPKKYTIQELKDIKSKYQNLRNFLNKL